jgi:hypothetical protein
MDFNHQYYGGFVVDLFNMILMQTIILKTSITMDSLYLKLFNYLSYGVIVILFIYSIKLHPHFNDSFHKTTDERYLKTRKRYNTFGTI